MLRYRFQNKVKYHPPFTEPFTLEEYLVFLDQEDSRRFLLGRFRSHVAEVIRRAEFEVTQVTKADQGIRKSSFVFENLAIHPFKSSVPPMKIEIGESCDHILAKLVCLETDQKTWENGSWKTKTAPNSLSSVPQKKEVRKERLSFLVFVPLGIVACFILVLAAIFLLLNR